MKGESFIKTFCNAVTAACLAGMVAHFIPVQQVQKAQVQMPATTSAPVLAFPDVTEEPEPVQTLAPKPAPVPTAAKRVGIVYVSSIVHAVSAYTPYDDPGFGTRYANANFLPGGRWYNPAKPFMRSETFVDRKHYTVAVPSSYRHLHEKLVKRGKYYHHKYLLRIEGYTPEGVYAVPRDRITKYNRFDILLTGWRAQSRARKWGVREVVIDVFKQLGEKER